MTKEIIKQLLTFRNTVKMYHWRATIYSKHKVVDKLTGDMDELIDKFVEVLIGNRKERPNFSLDLKIKEISDDTIDDYLESFRDWISDDLPSLILDHETDLFNIKDEILANINQSLYLVRMK